MAHGAYRRLLAAGLLVLGSGAWLPACSSGTDSGASAPRDDSARILVDHTPASITIENKGDVRLLGVRIELSVAESEMPYILIVPAIEKDTKGEFQLSTFKTDAADVLVDPSAVHPKQVTVRARDTFGKPHEVTVPWGP